MGKIPLNAVKKWNPVSSYQYPASFDTECAHCKQLTNHVVIYSSNYDGNTQTAQVKTRCTRCDGNMLFWIIKPKTRDNTCEAIFSFPEARESRDKKFDEYPIPERILRAYQDANRSFNAGIWDATATMCGKALEGVTKMMLPEEERKGMLGQQLQKLPKHKDLTQPFLNLTKAIVGGRNLGAHFDLEKETDKEMAEAMLQLVEHVLEYVYVFEVRAKEVSDRLLSLNDTEAQEEKVVE